MCPEQRDVNPVELTPELKSLEAALASLACRPASVDRDRMMFEAGWQAAERGRSVRRWAWPAVAAVTTAAAASLLCVLLIRPPDAERVVYVPVRSPLAAPDDGRRPVAPPPTAADSPDAKLATNSPAPLEVPSVRAPSAPNDLRRPGSYVPLRNQLLSIESWAPPAGNPAEIGATGAPESYMDLRRELLGRSAAGPSGPPYL